MALFNYANREITAKIVYYGPGVCGKTTSLQYIHERISPAQRGRLLSLATETDRTIFFDLLPLKLGEIGGFKLRFQLYTVPGQVKYNKTRKLVLQGADAVVFVADSQVSRREANIMSIQNLRDNLQEQNRRLEDLPLVYAYNKRDMGNILSVEDLNKDLNPRNLPFFEAIATEGSGVMETLEAISAHALDDMEKRLTAGSSKVQEPQEEQEDEELLRMMEDDNALLDLTNEEDEALSFSTAELDSLDLGSELDGLGPLESNPIGYDNEVTVEEIEIRGEDVAHTGTLTESEFFNLKDIEEQALRELDSFLEGNDEEEALNLSLEGPGEELPAVEDSSEDALDFSFDDESLEEEPIMTLDSPLEASGEERPDILQVDTLDFSLGEEESLAQEETEGALDFSLDEESLENEETGGMLDLSLDEEPQQPEEDTELAFSLDESSESETLDFGMEAPAGESKELSIDLSSDDSEFTLDEEFGETDLDLSSEENLAEGGIESLDLSDSDLDFSFGEQETEQADDLPTFTLDGGDAEGESTFTVDDDDLAAFDLDEESLETPGKEIEALNFGENELSGSSAGEFPESQSQEFSDFQITDSVRFEMQVGEDMSSVTPFEQQLEQLSEDGFAGEEEQQEDEFQPEVSEATEDESFQTISDEWTRLIVLAKYFYHRGETYRAQHTTGDNLLAVMMYYTAVDTALKAVALKYETCNPAIASFHLMLESIEEETEKSVAGAQSLLNNIVVIKNRIQLETGYPDDEECELAARISERFLSSLAEDFLTIDFSKLSPVLAQAEGK